MPAPIKAAENGPLGVPAPTLVDALLGRLLSKALHDAPDTEVLQEMTTRLAELLGVPLILLCRPNGSGILGIAAASARSELRIEFDRIPERTDGSIAGKGPGVRALREGRRVYVTREDEGLLPWKTAAVAAGVTGVAAWPLCRPAVVPWVWMVFGSYGQELQRPELDALAGKLEAFLADLQLLRSRQLVAGALEGAGNAAYITDLDGIIEWANPSFLKLAGYELNEVIGKNPRILKSGKQSLRYYQSLWEAIRKGEVFRSEVIDKDADGKLYVIRQVVSPIWRSGAIRNFISIHEEITHERWTAEQRERAMPQDPLTGLSPRAVFEDSLRDAVVDAGGGGNRAALAMLVLPELEKVRESLGEEAGAAFLREIGGRVTELLNAGDSGCYWGRGEFRILLHCGPGTAPPQESAKKILVALAQPYPFIGDADLVAKVGIATCPEDATDPDQLALVAESHLQSLRHLRQD